MPLGAAERELEVAGEIDGATLGEAEGDADGVAVMIGCKLLKISNF